MKHFTTPTITPETHISVTLSVLDWLAVQTSMAYAAQRSIETDQPSTAQIIREVLARIRPQTMYAIEAAADADETEQD